MTKRRIIRQLPPPKPTWDERMWPACASAVLFGGLLAAITIHLDRNPRLELWGGPLPWLSLIVGGTVATLWYLWYRAKKQFRPVSLLAFILSLTFNTALIGILGLIWVFAPEMSHEPVLARDAPSKPVTIPEYLLPRMTVLEEQRDFERPIETETPESVATNSSREDSAQANLDRQQQSETPASAIAQTESPTRERATPSPPRRSEDSSLLRRQLAQSPSTTQQPALPSDTPSDAAPAREEQSLAANNTDVTKRETESELERASMSEETSANENESTASTARREETTEDVAQTEAAPALPRRQNRARELPRSAQPRPVEAVASRETNEDAIQPAATEVNRQQMTVDIQRPQQQVEFAQPNAQPQETQRREIPREPAEQLAQTPRLERQQTARLPTTAPLSALANDTATPQQPEDARVTPSTTAVTRQIARANDLERATIPDRQAENTPTEQTPRMERRTNSDVSPSVVASRAVQMPTRTRRLAEAPVSPRAVSAPAVAAANRDTANPSAEPNRTAVTRAETGVAGMGRSENLDQNLPSAEGMASLASASAQRSESTQSLPDAMAMSPSLPSRQSRSRVDRQAPSASVRAEAIESALTYGAEEPTPLDASASAAVTRSASNAESATATAERGTTEVDFGPTQIVNSQSTGRASGGGQPELNPDTQSRLLSRAESGGAQRPSIMSTQVANVPAAPAGGDSAAPATADAHPDASSVARTESGGAATLSRGASSATDTGNPSFSSFADVEATPQLSRSAAAESVVASPSEGGGLGSRRLRTNSGPATNSIVADLPSLAGSETSSGDPGGEPIEATGSDVGRTAAGIEQATLADNVGSLQQNDAAVVGEALRDSRAGIATASASPSESLGPLADSGATSLPRRRRTAGLTSPARVQVTNDQAIAGGPSSTSSDPTAALADGGASVGAIVRNDAGALSLDRATEDGPAGLAMAPGAQPGVPTPKAQAASTHLEAQDARFIRRKIGGGVPTTSAVVSSTRAFNSRDRRGDASGAWPNGQPPPKTEEAIELGLVFVTRHQRPDGRWSLDFDDQDDPAYGNETNSMNSDTAATGLSLLAYLGAGYHHKDDKYRQQVQAGLDHLISNQKESGDLYAADDPISAKNVALYSHAIAALSLCEAYGMTQDPALRGPAQRALNFCMESQHAKRGGWRYTPGVEADTSVSGWMIMALKSGELAGLDVNRDTYARATAWLDRAQLSSDESHLYRYNPYAPNTKRQGHGLKVTPTMTAVGLLMRMYTGWSREKESMKLGGDYLLESLPAIGTPQAPERDTYYWYYASQVMFHLGEEHWESWNKKLHPLLVDSQVPTGKLAGSWNPRGPVPDRWANFAGRHYVTTLNLLSLEVYYRHLPIYEETAK